MSDCIYLLWYFFLLLGEQYDGFTENSRTGCHEAMKEGGNFGIALKHSRFG